MDLTIGEKIRALREDLDMNQTELGKALNMTQRKISYMECGKYPPSAEDLCAICNYFGISADYFLGLKKGLKYPQQKRSSDKCQSFFFVAALTYFPGKLPSKYLRHERA